MVKSIVFTALTLTACVQAVSQQSQMAQAVQSTPVTKVLALGHLSSPPSGDGFAGTMQAEVRDTVRLYLAGKIDQWYVRKDQNGVVFVLNTSSLAEAKQLLDGLPLGKAHMMEFDLIPLGPLTPLGLLVRDAPAPSGQK